MSARYRPILRGSELADAWSALKRRAPRMRQRDAAVQLGVSEADLVASLAGRTSVRLGGRWIELLGMIGTLGPVKAITRNEDAVIESWGRYLDLATPWRKQPRTQHMDLQFVLAKWHSGFALEETTTGGPCRSLQFFDEHGGAIHKVYLQEESSSSSWRTLVETHRSAAPPPRPTRRVVSHGWRADDSLDDEERLFDRPASPRAWRMVLEACSQQLLPVNVAVRNRGLLHSHGDVPRKLTATGAWWNIQDAEWNVHLRESAVAQAWVVQRSGPRCTTTSLELHDRQGSVIASLSGTRESEGCPEWRALMAAASQLD